MPGLRSDPINFDDYWPPIEKLITNILHQRYEDISNDRWQETFFDIYKVCVAQEPEPLVGKLYKQLNTLLEHHVKELYRVCVLDDTTNLLPDYYEKWVIYKSAADYLDKLFNYLNTQHLKRIKKPMQADVNNDSVCAPGLEVKDLCLYLWQTHMVDHLHKSLVYLLKRDIESDRKGISVNQNVIRGIVHSLAEVEDHKKEDTLELYKNAFETPFLESTSEYYRIEAERYRSELNCSDYMKKVLQLIEMETIRCTKFIHSSSIDKVISEVRSRMVADHSKFLHKESENMVASDCWQDLKAMYKLLKPIDGGLRTMTQQVQSHITQVGLEAIKQVTTSENPPKAFVESFMQVHRKHSDLIADVFSNDQLFVGALDKACSAIINYRISPQQPCRSPELLAKYCDSLLRKPSGNSNQSGSSINKTLSESEIDEKLALSIIVFKYIDDKDVFQKFYSKNMAKRLIFSQLASMDAEELMINKLKQVCGYEFTAKLHRMFTDIGLSNELRESFNQSLREKDTQLGLNFSIYILQAGSWPLGQTPVTVFRLPEILANSVKAFEEYYYKKFNGRVLTWLYHHCTADLKLCYTKRQYSVTMQTFHAAILLLFELHDELTYDEICKHTQLSVEQLDKHLQGLLEFKILTVTDGLLVASTSQRNELISQGQTKLDDSQPSTSQQYTLTPASKIRLNLDFNSKRTKFKISVIQRDTQYHQVREQSESEQTHSSIDEDRKLYIQAAIVRIMKSRKSAKHNHLIQEVIGLTKNHFTPSVPMIKKCIEILIEKQYLERKTNVADEYKYVA